MVDKLLEKAARVNEDVKRNVLYVPTTLEAFLELLDHEGDVDLIEDTIKSARSLAVGKNKLADFYYTAAIEYPFVTEPYMASRYSDGRYAVWYGSKSLETTLHETVHHTIKYLKAIEGIENEKEVIRTRSVYDVYCDAIMIDVIDLSKKFPDLMADDYSYTQELGETVYAGGYPGIISSSARHKTGINVNVFRQKILSNPRLITNLEYRISIADWRVNILDGSEVVYNLG